MEERLKQRLVGAVVLASLAVVFVPILFDLPPEVNDETSTTVISGIPERPRDGFGSSAGGALGAPQTPRLDDEVERERNREASGANAEDRGVSVNAAIDDSPSSASDAAASPAAGGASQRPASGTRSEPSVARSDPAPAAKKARDGSGTKPAVEKAQDGSGTKPAAKKAQEGSGTKPAVETSAAGGWTVQLGSFLKSENALALRKRLQARGYTAFVESGSSARGSVSRVFVGPMPDREQARSSAAKLRREMGLEGIVLPHRGG